MHGCTISSEWILTMARFGVARFLRLHRTLYRLARESAEYYLWPAYRRVQKLIERGTLPDDTVHVKRLAVVSACRGSIDAARALVGKEGTARAIARREGFESAVIESDAIATRRHRHARSRSAERARLARIVDRLLAAIPSRNRTIVSAHYGLDGLPPRTMKEIAAAHAISESRVCAIVHGALATMRGERAGVV
jgi:hypothetical protein